MVWESSGVVRFDLGPLLQGQTSGYPNLKVLITHFLLALEVWGGKPTYRKSIVLKSAYNSLSIGPRGFGW